VTTLGRFRHIATEDGLQAAETDDGRLFVRCLTAVAAEQLRNAFRLAEYRLPTRPWEAWGWLPVPETNRLAMAVALAPFATEVCTVDAEIGGVA